MDGDNLIQSLFGVVGFIIGLGIAMIYIDTGFLPEEFESIKCVIYIIIGLVGLLIAVAIFEAFYKLFQQI